MPANKGYKAKDVQPGLTSLRAGKTMKQSSESRSLTVKKPLKRKAKMKKKDNMSPY